MKSIDRLAAVTAVTLVAAAGSSEAASAKQVRKAPKPTISLIAKRALHALGGADRIKFLDRSRTGLLYDYDNKDGTSTEVTIKSDRAKNGYPDPSKTWLLKVTKFASVRYLGAPGIAPLKEHTISTQDGILSAERDTQDPFNPNVMHAVEAITDRGIRKFDISFQPGFEGEQTGNETYSPGVNAARQKYALIGRQTLAAIAHLGS